MPVFRSTREAKEYLAGRILAEARREGHPLSDVERKMLYFAETGWTLPDMAEASAEFDRTCNQDEYEQKIAALVRNLLARSQGGYEREAWDQAVEKLSEEDHYLLVLIGAGKRSAVPDRSEPMPEPDAAEAEIEPSPGRTSRVLVAAMICVVVLGLCTLLVVALDGP
jgi:hypothetical protein